MEEQTPKVEGTAVPTPPTGMSENDSAQVADQQGVEAKSAEVKFAEQALGREFSSVEEAKKAIVNLNKFVGDQTISKQRKALESLAKQANLTQDELIEVIETQALNPTQVEVQTPTEVVKNLPDDTTKRVVRIETDAFIKDVPEAAVIRDTLFAEALQTGKSVNELWVAKYAPIVEAGKKLGAKKLQTTTEGQPLKVTSADMEQGNTKIDFSKMSSEEMEIYLGYKPPKRKL
ncbi:MAG: hypothetical protein NUV85_02330 [Candidatus Berkelbacteria bacterium]|nr:hypothetical protein [Candidatus Berkelbacteria bacterium]